jgi:hypothetical protein
MKMEAAAFSTEFIPICETTQHDASFEVPTVLISRLVALLGHTIP